MIRALLYACFAVLALAAVAPATAIEPAQREVVVVTGRVWEGSEYREIFVPSTMDEVTLIHGQDSALLYARTLEYYWPLSRLTYVDFDRQREVLDGELVIRRDGRELARSPLSSFSIVYPDGALNGNGQLLWGDAAESSYLAYREQEARFARDYAAVRRAHGEYERQLLAAGAAQAAGEPVRTIDPPPPLPEPSLRLVTVPQPGFRMGLDPGNYTILLERDGEPLPGTERRLRVIGISGTDVLVADVIPEERWTRPLAANADDARIFARPGTTFYVTLAEASRFLETDYLPVVRPQSEAVTGREIWVRRQPSEIEALQSAWAGAERPLERRALKVEQTRGASFGYVVRGAREGESVDIEAFAIDVPDDGDVSRGMLRTDESGGFMREVVIVRPANAGLAFILALLPLSGALLTARGWWRRRATD